MSRPWRWLIPLATVPVLALLAYGFRANPRDIPSPLVGRPAPSFALASRNRFFLCVQADDPKFDLTQTRRFLEEMEKIW